MVTRFYRFIVDWPKTALGILAVLTMVLAGFASQIRVDNSIEALFLESDPTMQYFREFTDLFGSSEIAAIAFTDGKSSIFTHKNLDLIQRLTTRIENEVPYVVQVISLTNANLIEGTNGSITIKPFLEEIPKAGSPKLVTLATEGMKEPLFRKVLISDDGKTTSIIVKTEYRPGDDKYRAEITAKLRQIVAEEAPGVDLQMGGPPIFLTVFNEYIVKDLLTFGPIIALVLMVLLFFTFRHINGVVLPMLTIVIGLIWTFGFMVIIGKKINLATTIIPPLIAVIGVANVIHFINIFTHEISLGKKRKAAVFETLSHLGTPMFMSSLTTVVGFASLMVSDISVIRETGLISAFGILATLLASLVAPPILLMWTKPNAKAVAKYEATLSGGLLGTLLDHIQNVNEKHPKLIITLGMVVALFFGFGISKINVETNFFKYFKDDSDIVKAQNFIQKHLSGVAPLEVLVDATKVKGGIKNPTVMREMDSIESHLLAEPLVDHVFSPVDYIKILRRAFYSGEQSYYTLPTSANEISQLFLVYDLQGGGAGLEDFRTGDYDYGRISARLQDAGTNELRGVINRAKTQFHKATSGAQYHFADNTNLIVHIVDNLIWSQAESLGLAFILIFFMMAWFLKGFRLGLMGMVPNVFPIVIVLGTMGYLGIDLNVSTVMVPAIAIGLAVDDTIHLFSRFAQQRQLLESNVEAARATIHSTGRACIFTSVSLCAGFLVLGLSNFYPNLYFGILAAITVAAALFADLTISMAMLRLWGPKVTH